jgi:hypothetical protein
VQTGVEASHHPRPAAASAGGCKPNGEGAIGDGVPSGLPPRSLPGRRGSPGHELTPPCDLSSRLAVQRRLSVQTVAGAVVDGGLLPQHRHGLGRRLVLSLDACERDAGELDRLSLGEVPLLQTLEGDEPAVLLRVAGDAAVLDDDNWLAVGGPLSTCGAA